MTDSRSFEDLFHGLGLGQDFNLDTFLGLLGRTGAERSPREHLDAAMEALTAAQRLGNPDAYTRALDNFRRAMERVREL